MQNSSSSTDVSLFPYGATVALAIEDVTSHPFYLGNKNAPSLVVFKKGSPTEGDRLVPSDPVASNADDVEDVSFVLIAKVHEFEHFLHPDGTNVGGSEDSVPPKTRLRLGLQKPTHVLCSALDAHWDIIWSNVEKIAKKMLLKRPGCRLPFNKDGNAITVSHKIMMEAPSVQDEESGDKDPSTVSNSNSVPEHADSTKEEDGSSSEDEVHQSVAPAVPAGFEALFTVKGWPASERWHALAKPFENSHTAVPMNAYDQNGILIHPELYKLKLPGATVEAKINFLGFHIANSTSVMIGEVESLNILIPSSRPPSAAAKRRAALLNKVTKRRRLDKD